MIYIASAIFLIVYAIIVSEKIPGAIIAMVGAMSVVGIRILSQEQAIHFIDWNTIGLLCGMMIMIAILRKTGLFEYIAIKAIKLSGSKPWNILVILSLLTAAMSAILDNVTSVLMIVPITLAITDVLRISPTSFLISEIIFSNIGGTATLIGDPPNILIGSSAKIGFMPFLYHNLPVVILIAYVTLLVLKLIYRQELNTTIDTKNIFQNFSEEKAIQDKKLLLKSSIVFILCLLCIILHDLLHLELATVALLGGFTLLLITDTHLDEILREVEWATLFFFIGLFILIGGLEITGVVTMLAIKITEYAHTTSLMTFLILWGSALASTIVDNVPFTATMIPVIKSIGVISDISLKPLWWSLSLGACLGGNGTIIGAAANIVVANCAKKNRHTIKFFDFLKVGFPLMLLSIAISMAYIYIIDLIFFP